MATKKTPVFNLKTLEDTLEKYFGKQAPQLPKSIVKAIVDFGPWLLAISAIFTLPGLIASLGLTSTFAPYYYRAWRHSSFGLASVVITLIAYGLSLIAIPGLFKKSIKAWRLLFYSSLVNLVGSLIDLNLVSLIISAAIGWYFLFQIKSSYK